MAVYHGDFSVLHKNDSSPVTEADQKAEELIASALARLYPNLPIVAEEAVSAGDIPQVGKHFWLVDPLDGTKEFISRNGEFTVNVALIDNGQPILGVVLAPAIGQLYAGIVGHGAFMEDSHGRRKISSRLCNEDGLTIITSRSHGDTKALEKFLDGRQIRELRSAGSSLKLCLVATGEADIYPRLGRTMEWDIAAGQAVLMAAGGTVEDLHGMPLCYGKPNFENPHFVAMGRK